MAPGVVELSQVAADAAVILTAVAAMGAFAYRHFERRSERAERRFERIDQRLDGMDRRLDSIERRLDTLTNCVILLMRAEGERDPRFHQLAEDLGLLGGNAYDPARRKALLRKLWADTITNEEGDELAGYLEEDLARARTPREQEILMMAMFMAQAGRGFRDHVSRLRRKHGVPDPA